MDTTQVNETRLVSAPARHVYDLLADYRHGHPRVLPEGYFTGLDVEQGGRGAGTVIRVRMKALGVTREMRMAVSEPEPGRVLAETDLATGLVTSFIVEPVDASRARVTISTVWRPRPGIFGELERRITTAVMRRIYTRELAKIEAVVSQEAPSARRPDQERAIAAPRTGHAPS